jgi:hypothetical protein
VALVQSVLDQLVEIDREDPSQLSRRRETRERTMGEIWADRSAEKVLKGSKCRVGNMTAQDFQFEF